MVIAPASTGRDRSSRNEVTKIPQQNKFSFEYVRPGALILKIVTIKLMEPKIEETPEMCNAKITQSTELSKWPTVEDRGGYRVHPVPAPDSIKKLFKR